MHMPPMGDVERRMTVVRLADGRLVIWSAIALDRSQMQELEAFGSPTYLIVPGDLHRMDAHAWKERYPQLVVITPAAARAKVEEIVHVDATEIDFKDPHVRYLTVPGTGEREAALISRRRSRYDVLVLNDLIFDLANREGLSGWLFKAIVHVDRERSAHSARDSHAQGRGQGCAQCERSASGRAFRSSSASSFRTATSSRRIRATCSDESPKKSRDHTSRPQARPRTGRS